MPGTKNLIKKSQWVIGPRKDHTTVTLIDGPVVKLTSKYSHLNT